MLTNKTFKRIFLLLAALLVAVLAVGTFVEQRQGGSYAREHVYYSWWFVGLWALLAVLSAVVLVRKRLWRRLPVFMLHVSLLLILAGAFTSFMTSREGVLHLRKGTTADYFYLNPDYRVERLPFTLRLDSFRVDYFPGTQAPADFISMVSVGETNPTEKSVISMNNILSRNGYRFYQTSFDADHDGTILTVKYDPWGIAVTYGGYLMLALSMIWVLLARGEEFRRLLRHPLLRKGSLFVGLLAVLPLQVHAREAIPTISAAKAEKIRSMQVVYNDRVVPLNTLALDFMRKIYGKDTYRGLTAEQVLVGWSMRPDAWKDQPMVKIKNAQLCQALGVEGKYATFAQLFNGKEYKLSNLTAGGPDDQGMMKAVQELDEKVGLIIMATQGQLVTPRPKEAPALSENRVAAELLYNSIPFSKVLFMVCLTLGFLSFFLMTAGILRRRPAVFTGLRLLLVAALLFHAFGYALRWYISGRVPMGNGFETMIFMTLVILLLTALFHSRLPLLLPFGFLLSGFTLLVSWLAQQSPQITPLMPVLNSPLLSSHVSVIMVAYALLAFILLNGLFALVLIVRNRKTHAHQEQIAQLTVLSRLMLYPAVFLLAVGIFLGALWANISWGRYWGWDPKEVWALITLLVYSVAFHSQSIALLRRPAYFHAYLVAAFLMVLMTYFGVNYFLGGMHSYA